MVSFEQLLAGLQIAIAVMIIIVLYHVLFISVDLRKIMRRIEGITAEIEGAVMKPISVADQLFSWVMEFVEKEGDKTKKKAKKIKKSKKEKKEE